MLRFIRAQALRQVWRRLKPLQASPQPLGSVTDYVLIEQEAQHVTKFTRKEPPWQGYITVRYYHDATDREQGGPPGQKYLVLYSHFEERIRNLQGGAALYLSKTKTVCLGEIEGGRIQSQSSLKSYPGSYEDFAVIQHRPMPPLTTEVPLTSWLAAAHALRSFAKTESQDSNHPLILLPDHSFVAFHRNLAQVLMRIKLLNDGSPISLISLPAGILDRFCRVGSNPVSYGVQSDCSSSQSWFGLQSRDMEFVCQQRGSAGYLEQIAKRDFWDKLNVLCRRFVAIQEFSHRLSSVRPDSLEGQGLCWVETGGYLRWYPERSFGGETYAQCRILPHPDTSGEWLALSLVYEYLHEGIKALYIYVRELKMGADDLPPVEISVLGKDERYFLRLRCAQAEVLMQVVPAAQAIDQIDLDE